MRRWLTTLPGIGDALQTTEDVRVTDYSETCLRIQKLVSTYYACAALNQWQAAEDAAAEIRLAGTDLLLFARMARES